MEITAIEGVGAKTAERLSALDDPERALRDGDVATLARAPGISEGRAARIARATIRDRHDDPGGFLATTRAREIYRAALNLLQERTVTDYAHHRLETIYPSAVPARIDEVREFADRAMERSPTDETLAALSGVEPLSQPGTVRVRDRCIATGDAERYAEASEALPELSVELVDGVRQLSELARGYSTVIALDEQFAGLDVDGNVRVEPSALKTPAEVVPERVLAFFAHNRTTIRAAIDVHREAGLETECDLASLEAALDQVRSDGSVRGDEELERLETAVDDLDAAVSEAERFANDHLRSAIEQRDVTIDGTDLLSLVEQGAGVNSLLERELADEYDRAIELARETLVDTLALEETEPIARRAFGDEVTYPVSHDESTVSRLRTRLTAAQDRRAARRKRELAGELAATREECERLVRDALELDVEYAISRFASDFECRMPEFGGRGFAIDGGRSPLLDASFDEVEPVDYHVEGVTLLSGVNSGGKTSTLDLVAFIVTLAHMGLPVPATHARVERLEEVHYHAKTQGTLDAGAFESTLREFASLVAEVGEDRQEDGGGGAEEDEKRPEDGVEGTEDVERLDGKRAEDGVGGADEDGPEAVLVLVDELESITEPGASASIIAGILEALGGRTVTAVFVSHLAGEIREAAHHEIAVDGIQARGLEDGELLVDRSPVKGTLARSTPELIVEKLADEDTHGDFYRSLLEKFDED